MNNLRRVLICGRSVTFSKTDAKDNLIIALDKEVYYWNPISGFDNKRVIFNEQLIYACQVMWGWL